MKEIRVDEKTRHRLNDQTRSSLAKYQEMVVGREGLLALLHHELVISLFNSFPGGLGFILRRRFYGGLLGQMGNGVILGKDLTLRYLRRIRVGHRVAIDEGCLIDARGAGDRGIIIGEDVIIGRQSVIQAKFGPIQIGNKTNIGPQCIMSSINEIIVGEKVLIAAHCYIGGGFYHSERTDIPMMEQGVYSKGPVLIGDDVWLGAGAVVLDGVQIGKGCIVGAGAIVTRNLPDYCVCAGVPARVIRYRKAVPQAEIQRKTEMQWSIGKP